MIKNLILLSTVLTAGICSGQYDGKMGVNTEEPTEVLDVNGNGRFRNLADGLNTSDFPRVVVAKEDGTLGYRKTEVLLRRILSLNLEHTAPGLKWNTRNEGLYQTSRQDGAQTNFLNYLVFGLKNDVSASSGSYTSKNTTFSASAGESLNIQSIISFGVYKNAYNTTAVTLDDLAANGDRQVVIYLYLYKGDTLIRKVKQITNFRGRTYDTTNESGLAGTNKGYDAEFNQAISMSYLVPEGGDGDDYSVSIVITSRAPYDGNFRTILDGYSQKLVVSK